MNWTVTLSDGRTAQVQADEITTRQDGSLWLLKAVAKPPAPLVAVAVLARGTWTSRHPEDTTILWTGEPRPAKPDHPKPTPRAV